VKALISVSGVPSWHWTLHLTYQDFLMH
jgi:hypothetical protein